MALQLSQGVTRPTLAGLTAVAMFSLSFAHAHGPAEWIQRGDYKNAVGELCCGERDCGFQVGGEIHYEKGGYRVDADFQIGSGNYATVVHVREFVPEAEATPSPDGTYWRCYWGGKRKRFFAPPGTT